MRSDKLNFWSCNHNVVLSSGGFIPKLAACYHLMTAFALFVVAVGVCSVVVEASGMSKSLIFFGCLKTTTGRSGMAAFNL